MATDGVAAPTRVPSGARARAPDFPPVMYLGDHLGYPGGVVHGVTAYLLHVLPELARRGIEVTACFLRGPHPAATRLEASGVECSFLSAAPWSPLVVPRVIDIARARGCRVIHASGIKATLVARIVARAVGAEAVLHIHDQIMPPWPIRALSRMFGRNTDSGICVSMATVDVAVHGYALERSRVSVIYNGIDLAQLRDVSARARGDVRSELGIAADAPVVTMIARMHPMKGNATMVRIMRRVVDACPGAVLVFAGDGPDRAACEALVADLGLVDHTRFLGHRHDVPELLAAADLVVVPSRAEGLGLAAIEALAAGRPVVAFDVGGLKEVVSDGVDGYCVPPGDEAAFAAAVTRLLGDGSLLQRFGERARENATRFGLPAHMDRLLECYRRASGA